MAGLVGANGAHQSALGKAIGYGQKQWPKLTQYIDSGRLEMDNNRAERAVKLFVIGRKNWLFSASTQGAEASAALYIVIETAKANGLEPSAYLTHLFEQLPGAETAHQREALLPWT